MYAGLVEWDLKLGVKLQETDASGNRIRYRYDDFGRITEVKTDYDTGAIPYVILNTFAKDKIYYYDVFSRMLDKEFIDKYNLSEILCGINYELFKSSNGDVRIVLVYKGD